MIKKEWQKTSHRFVAYFDIMGFKDLVARASHQQVLERLEKLKVTLNALSEVNKYDSVDGEYAETKSITFSDSIIIFSREDSLDDAKKILFDSIVVLKKALQFNVPIKGCLSYGEITVDFDNSLFFGQPIIDAYLLHDELQLYGVISDNLAEAKFMSFNHKSFFDRIFIQYKTPLKSGKISHNLIIPSELDKAIEELIGFTKMHYELVSGRPRLYIDNTLEFLNYLLKSKKN